MFDVGQENVGPLECDWVRICAVGGWGNVIVFTEKFRYVSFAASYLSHLNFSGPFSGIYSASKFRDLDDVFSFSRL